MAQQTINIGASPNDGTGTPLRTSFDYTNQNFTELYTALGGGVGLPGATTQVIFNDGGTNLAGDAGLVYNKTTDALTVAGLVTAGSATITGDLTVRTTKLAVTSTGVGCGTATPANQLSVRNEGASGVSVIDVRGGTGGAGALQISGNGTTLGTTSFDFIQNGAGAFILNRDATPLAFSVNGSERYNIGTTGISTWSVAGTTAMTLNSIGLAIGVTPNTWTSYKALQVNSASIWSTTANDTAYASNVYYDGAYKFRSASSDKACMYIQFGGSHQWHYTAAAGTAGNTATFTQAMTLDASGNLLVGTVTSPTGTKIGSIAKLGKVSVEGTSTITVTTSATPLARAFDTGGLFFVSGYNNVGGSRGWWLVAAGGTAPVVIASDNLTGLVVAFTSPSDVLNMNTVSGSLSVTAISLTNQGV